MITIDAVLEEKNLELAMNHLLSKRDSCGIDNVRVSEFPTYWDINGTEIMQKIRNGSYEPDIILEKEIIGYNGKRRIISLMTCTDRLILRALAQVLQPVCEQHFCDFSHAYRSEYGVETAVRMSLDYIRHGKIWMAEMDIENFFDSIPILRMKEVFNDNIEVDEKIELLIAGYLYCRIERMGKIETKQKGLVMGSPISPLLSNLYLNAFDHEMNARGYSIVRFADDIRIFCGTDKGAEEALEQAKQQLEQVSLKLNLKKSGVFRALNRNFLGYRFETEKNGDIVAKKYKKEKNRYQNWHPSALQRTDKNYYLINDGILTKKDFSLLFENENGKKYLPVEMTDSICAYSEIIFGSHFFEFIAGKRIRVVLFDKYGRTVGAFCSEKYAAGGKTVLKQAELYLNSENRLQLAKKIEMAAMHNMRSNLRYYKKQKKSEELEQAIRKISEIITEMNESMEIDSLMLLEARARQMYYRAFNEIIIDPTFKFLQRSKRPPRDPLNAMISFGNVYLYNRLSTEIHKTSLDIRIGILHSTNARAESLNLDIAELFKPILVDRTIFTLVNKKMIHSKEHFEVTDTGGIFLNKSGKHIFIEELQKKIYQTIQIGESRRTYEYLMRAEIQKILRHVLYREIYKPYKYTS